MFLLSQRNSFYNAIKEHGLNHQHFKLVEPDKNSIRLIHEATGFYFLVNASPVQLNGTSNTVMRLYTRSTPKRDKLILATNEQTTHGPIDDWLAVVHLLKQWLTWLKSEAEQPNLWAEMEGTPHLFADEEPATDDNFTPAEIKLLEERVAEVEHRVLALNLPAEAEAAVVETVREVPAKAKRFTKKELADCIVGSLVKEGFKWGLTTEHMSATWHACQYFFTFLLTS